MHDDLSELLARLQSMTPEERAHLLSLTAGDAVAGGKVGGDKGVELQGTVNLGADGRIDGIAVGVYLGKIIYGRDPDEDEQRRLVRYLERLAAKLQRLQLRGLAASLDDGQGILLPHVYIRLAIPVGRVYPLQTVSAAELEKFVDTTDPSFPPLEPYSPDHALPGDAIVNVKQAGEDEYVLQRAILVIEAVDNSERLVLLGEPGGGKSTFLRYLAWTLAMHGLGRLTDEQALLGWNDEARLPVLLSLRTLAGRIALDGPAPATVLKSLCDELTREYNVREPELLLEQALDRGAAILLFDGLDEVPLEAEPEKTADRLTTVAAVRAFAELYAGARIIVTCRTRAFDESLRRCLGWKIEQIAPLTLGQVRRFVAAWYAELIGRGSIPRELGDEQAATLVSAIEQSERLRSLASTPLLLTMMALVLMEKNELPRDRSLLYERILSQLLGEWDKHKGGQSLSDVIGNANLRSDDLRRTLDELSYITHVEAASSDGRGRLEGEALRVALAKFFELVKIPGAWEAAGRCLEYFNERSGLLLPEDNETYAFAHLTFQEYGAGRFLLVHQQQGVDLVMQYRADDRWREPIALGLGVVQKLYPMLADRINSVLSRLIHAAERGRPKPRERWYRDLIMAAELGAERDWNLLRAVIDIDTLQSDLRCGLVALLQDKTQPLPVAERMRAGFLLGDLGDPRFPVTLDEWRCELAKVQAGDTNGYFCRVEAGTYIIGSTDDDPDAANEEKPQHTVIFDAPFWIACYPITNAQWQAWVEQAGGQPSYAVDDADLNRPNQPVMRVNWHMCNDFCVWLSEQLGVTVRLPSEQEWEAAARGGDTRRYPWGEDWQDDRAATGEDQETRGWQWSVPVGCYPAGAAPCGALDMAGNVWDWTASEWQFYPSAQKPFTDSDLRVLRGGAWGNNRNSVRCGARGWVHPGHDFGVIGFRVVVAPRLAQ